MKLPSAVADSRPYRLNVGIVVLNRTGLALAGERVHYPGVFQYPQGGIDKGEAPLAAARRELYEEIGLRLDEEPIHELAEWLSYEFPESIPEHLKRFRGQKQRWFFFHWEGEPSTLALDLHDREFSRVIWADPLHLADNIVEFKKDIYRRLCAEAKIAMARF
ncbi:MAG: RNA pyrophosphohydrolase [Leptospirales bacterium]|nr:RNA pyrophosphohydrolase [Leptospirales bacterium]